MADLAIPYYREINDFLESIASSQRTSNPHFFCLRLKAGDPSLYNYKPPFRKDFYFIALVTHAGETRISYDDRLATKLDSFLVFQTPGLLYSFFRDNTATGYLIYFKPECLSFFKPSFEKEFPFFNQLHSNFFSFNHSKFNEFTPYFEDVFTSYESSTDEKHTVAAVKLLALLYQLKEFTVAFSQWEQGFSSPQQLLIQKFTQLVNNYYLEKRTIEEYAELLSVSAGHLSHVVKSTSNKNALSYINDRIITEAKALIRYTAFDIAEIAYQLNFSDPANFGKFFKKHTQKTPLEFRKSPS